MSEREEEFNRLWEEAGKLPSLEERNARAGQLLRDYEDILAPRRPCLGIAGIDFPEEPEPREELPPPPA